MKISARNTLPGRVVEVNHGAVNSEVTVELRGGDRIVSVITRHSAEALGLVPGMEVRTVVKASNVMIALD